MHPSHHSGKAPAPTTAPRQPQDGAVPVAAAVASDQPFGPHATQVLATEHWSLLATRSLIWNEALSRATVFLTVLSAAIIALALLADATGFGPHTTTLALVLLPVVLFLGIAAHSRLVDINREEVELVLARNRLRRAYLQIAPPWSPTSPPATTTTSRAWRPATCAPAAAVPVWGAGSRSWSTRPRSSRPWTPRLRRRSSCWWCGRPRPSRRPPWRRGRWRSWWCGRRCLCCNAALWTRSAGRRRGSPRRQRKPERPAGSAGSLRPIERGRPRWPPEIMAATSSQHPGPYIGAILVHGGRLPRPGAAGRPPGWR